ncbi:MAG: hypothetical protein LUE10_07105 [Alistipes sp.]|nr:hypothetical protein [Alistipes sp.]
MEDINEDKNRGDCPDEILPVEKKRVSFLMPFTRYLRELSVVIVGIAITFMISGWINRQREKIDLDNYLHAVKVELEDNLATFGEYHEIYLRTVDLTHYLQSDEPARLSRSRIDSIASHENYYVVNRFFVLTYKKSALEMLQSSGMMRKINNRDVTRSILDSYASLEALKKHSDDYMDRKKEILYRFLFTSGNADLDILSPDARELFIFLSIYVNMEMSFEECMDEIRATIALL